MKRNRTLDYKKALRLIRSYRKQLSSALRNGEDFKPLHSKIVLLLNELCSTKTEYKDVFNYRVANAIELVVVERVPDGRTVEVEGKRTVLRSEDDVIEERKAFGTRLDEVLAQLESKYAFKAALYKPQANLSKTELKDIKAVLLSIRDELKYIEAELSSLRDTMAEAHK